tara:strand:- start:666 stop:1049 length:384 start_codon:yes stop_codon:yes gene_type:complete
MNFHHALNKYKDSSINSVIESSDKHSFVKLVLEELQKHLTILEHCILNEKKTSPQKSKSFSKIITSLMILMNSLDFEKGEPIASNLYNLYDFCRRSVISDYMKLEIDGIKKSLVIVNDILTAWIEIR